MAHWTGIPAGRIIKTVRKGARSCAIRKGGRVYDSRTPANKKRQLLHGAELHGCQRQAQAAVDSHRTSRKGKQAPRREAAAGHPPELCPAGCEQGERGYLLRYAVCRLHGAVAGDYPQLGGKDHLFLLHADGKGEDRTVFPKHRADAGRNPSQAHSELLSA